ncbi:MAG: DUF4143 domain-containing protein [Tessaracoccus sp.]
MSTEGPNIDRRANEVLSSLIIDEPVVAIHGPRSVGKSTLLRAFAHAHGAEIIDLDDDLIRDAAHANPSAAVGGSRPVCIDEYQHVPDLLNALKARLNREGALPGTAVLTGSTRPDALPRTAQALTGRLHAFTLWPLAQAEIEGSSFSLLSDLRENPDKTVASVPTSSTTREEYARRICAGGFPLALRRQGLRRSRWFDDYIRASVERDAMDLMRVRQREVMREVLDRLVAQTAQVLNISSIADGLESQRSTIEGYVRLLEDLFLVTRLPAWGRTLAARVGTKPKLHVVDSGVAAKLLRVNEQTLATLDPAVLTEFGHLLETFVHGELRKHLSWMEEPATVGHWRTRVGHEVDVVMEFHDGSVLAFEVKAGERVSGADFGSLRKLRDLLGERFVAGVAFSTGTRSYTYEDRLHVMPVDRLWRTGDK